MSVKLSPYFTSFGHMAAWLDAAGVDGIVMFNRFFQRDIDVNTLKDVSVLELSNSGELLVRLHWMTALRGRVRASLALSGGIAVPEDGIKAILAGADVVQTVWGCSAMARGFSIRC